ATVVVSRRLGWEPRRIRSPRYHSAEGGAGDAHRGRERAAHEGGAGDAHGRSHAPVLDPRGAVFRAPGWRPGQAGQDPWRRPRGLAGDERAGGPALVVSLALPRPHLL